MLLFAPARADARFARTKGDYVRMLLQCLLGIAALLLPRVLHALSGAMLGALGFSVLTFLNKTEGIPVSMSPAFAALFTFCFALALDVLWEIYEFTVDALFQPTCRNTPWRAGRRWPARRLCRTPWGT